MKGNLIKVGVAVVTAVLIIAVTVMLLSGYMSAFKPGNNTTSSSSSNVVGGSAGNRPAALASPSPSLSANAPGSPGMPPGTAGMPARESPAGAMPEEQPELPGAAEPPALPGPQLTQGFTMPEMPDEQPVMATSAPGTSPATAGRSPLDLISRGGESWFNAPGSGQATPVATVTPVAAMPSPAPLLPAPAPITGPPVTAPGTPEAPATGLTPYEFGWRQVIQRLLEMLPMFFPGYSPGIQWFMVPSGY